MPITWQAAGGGRVEIAFSDPYTVQESEVVMKQIYADAGVDRPLRFLVDVRGSTPPDTEFVANAITFWQLHVNEMWDARVAVIIETARQGAMARLSENTVDARQLPFSLRVFHHDERPAAEEWLGSAGLA